MARQVKVVGIKRKEIDEEKLALAFLLLAKTLHDQKQVATNGAPRDEIADESEAA